MVKINRSELQGVHSSTQAARVSCLSNFSTFENGISDFSQTTALTGPGWESAKQSFEPYQTISKAMYNYHCDFGETYTSFLASFDGEVGATENVLDTDRLAELQAKINRIQQAKQELMIKISGNIIAEIVGGYGIRVQDLQIGQLQKKVDILEKYQAFESSHASDFTEIISVGNQLESALGELGKAKQFNVQTGMYNSPDFTNSQWYNDLVAYNEKSPSQRLEIVSTDVDGYYKVYVNGCYNEQATANYMFMLSKDGMKQLGLMGVTMAGEMTGAYSVYRLFTGKDPVTGDKVSRLEAALWTTALLVSQAGLITMAKELRAGNRLLSGTQLSAKDLALLTKTGYFKDVAKIGIIEKNNQVGRLRNMNINSFEIKNKHLNSSTAKRARKFNVSTAKEANAIVKDALMNGEVLEILPNGIGSQGQTSFSTIIDAGKVIGTKGETHIKIVYDTLNNIWTTYPVVKP
ncbi:pre-toxin TG domain-containing protein [uncultured Vagococcus sp.]|uniref:pre-toxin TG domain-containing protein n=1 Tax=uncultured Vagococcus sp. TaxID=189676 RepID=UPI0028D6F419|nr:pre-toxin TG domain-containing protein [uncultured Vagococcus sp.]